MPGSYDVWVNSSSQHNHLGLCVILAGETTSVTLPGTCAPEVSTPAGVPVSADVEQSVTFHTTLLGAGSGGDTYDWSSLAAGLGCTPSTSDSISCIPTIPGTVLRCGYRHGLRRPIQY